MTCFHSMVERRNLHLTYIERPELIRMLNEGLKTKLTIVTSPAGYGKTTILSQWVEQCGITAEWVSLDRQDNDLVQFWSYVIEAVETNIPNFSKDMSPHLTTLKSGAFEPFIKALLNEFGRISHELGFIFDDFHTIELASIHASVAYFLEGLPAHIHLYIVSRAELPFPTARLQSKGQVGKIMIEDLRFQLDEGIRYFHDCMGLSLSEEDISMLVHRTEGWISGLHLAALSLKRSNHYPDFIRAFSGQNRDIADYLFQEVLSHQSEQMRSFLLKTSILNRMNHSLCEAVTSQTNSQELLEMLEQQNLFLIPLDQQREWYRYHHLFSEFLQKQFRQKYSVWWKQLHANAADWLEQHGFFEEAVEHYLMGEYHLEAASLIERHLFDLQLKNGVLYRWFNELPESSIADKPGVQFLYVKVLAESEEMELAATRLRMLEDKLSDPEWKTFVGTFFYMSAAVAFYRKDFQRTTEYLELFERDMPEGSYIQMIEANAITVNYDSLLVFFNDLHEAEGFFYKWIQVWENKKNYPFVGFFYIAYSWLLYEWNRLEEAELYVERALRQKCMQPYALILVSAAISAARISQAKGDSAKAFDLLEQVKPKIDSVDKRTFVKKLDAEKAYLSFADGSFDDVTGWLQTCEFKHTDTVSLNDVREYVQLARALTECELVNEALQLLEKLYRLVDDEDRLRDKIKVCILQSIAFHRKGDATNALLKLEAALQLAEPGKYLRSFIDEGTKMADLLLEYLHQTQHHYIRKSANVSLLFVKELLLLMKVHTDRISIPGSLLTKQELRIIRKIEMGLSNKQIAGRLHVTAETVKSHLKSIYRKLGVSSRLQALQRGNELKLL